LRLFSGTLFTGIFQLQLEFSQEPAGGNGLMFEIGFFSFKYEKNRVYHETGLDDFSNIDLSDKHGFVIFY